MKFKEGDAVEVFKVSEDQYGGWFVATILFGNRHKYTVRYELFRTTGGMPVVETVNEEDVRPQPPPGNGRERWVTGDTAEVFDQNSWKVGKIAKVLKNGYVVMRIFGSIQLKEFHVTSIRIRQTWRDNQWFVIDKVNDEQIENDYTNKNVRQLDSGRNPAPGGENFTEAKPKKNHLDYTFPVTTMKRNLSSFYGAPDDIGKSSCKRRSPKGNRSHQMEQSALPRKVDALSFPKNLMAENIPRISSEGPKTKNTYTRDNKSYINNHNIDTQAGYSHLKPFLVSEDNMECSVASCSGNQFHGYTNVKNRHRLKNTDSKQLDDAMSSCSSDNGNDNRSVSAEELAASIHELELHAYQSTMQALYASGPLSWEQESLLTNLRLSLNISNEEHLLHLRHMLSV